MKSGGAADTPLSSSKLGQLDGGCGAPTTFPLAPLAFEYLSMQVYTFFWWRLYK